jgi:hypothetical protein
MKSLKVSEQEIHIYIAGYRFLTATLENILACWSVSRVEWQIVTEVVEAYSFHLQV